MTEQKKEEEEGQMALTLARNGKSLTFGTRELLAPYLYDSG